MIYFLLILISFICTNSNDIWKCHDKYCMIKPIEKKDHYLKTHVEEEPLTGIIKYSNKQLEKKRSIKEGD